MSLEDRFELAPGYEISRVIRGGCGRHLGDTLRIGSLKLTDEDAAGIGAVLAHRIPLQGDVYALERDRTGRHGSIMTYNLND